MDRREFIKVAGVAALGPAMLARAAEEKLNIIFLMTDQQRWDALGVTNPHVKTPNLDRLAKSGILFRQAVCQAPMCVPSRNSLMFGLYPSQVGVRTNAGGLCDESRLPTPPLPEVLRRAGYQTAGFGKTHWGHGKLNPDPPTRGFEVRAEGQPRGAGLDEHGATMMSDDNAEGLRQYQAETASFGGGEEGVNGYIGCTSTVPARNHRDGWIAEHCLKFLETGVDPRRPLFLYLSFLKPHAGFNVIREFEDLYDINTIPDTAQPPWAEEPGTHIAAVEAVNTNLGTRTRSWREAWEKLTPLERRRTTLRYWANCSWLDSYFGQALEKLEKMGRLKNCLIVYTSDHGEMLGERNWRFSKYCLFESSVRVPLILAGSAVPREKRGTIDDRPAELIDLAPTLARAAGAAAEPAWPGLDLLGEKKRAGSFCEFHGGGGSPQPAPSYMWRKKEWKLILFQAGTVDGGEDPRRMDEVQGELYDLEKDPLEWKNLYYDEKYGAVRERMKTELLMHLATAWAHGPAATDQGAARGAAGAAKAGKKTGGGKGKAKGKGNSSMSKG